MQTPYFTGTPAQAEMVANYLLWTHKQERFIGERAMGDIEIIMHYAGDTAVRVLYEDDEVLIYLSIDSCIKVVVTIDKEDFSKSQSIEI